MSLPWVSKTGGATMNSHGLIVAALIPLAIASPSHAGDRWCGDAVCICPQTSFGWTLFVDSNRGTPDFWWTDSVTVREIFICTHGVQFLFVTRQKGTPQHTALVFPRPTRKMLAHRLDLEPESDLLESEFDHFRRRFDSLVGSLGEISGGALVEGARMSFDTRPEGEAPVIVPKRRLELLWRGAALKLRGYLDVYFAPVV